MITFFELNIGFEIIKKHLEQTIFTKKFLYGLIRFFIVMAAWLISCSLMNKGQFISESKIGFFILTGIIANN